MLNNFMVCLYFLLEVIIFSSVWFLYKKKVTKPEFKKKTETGSNPPVSVRFGFLGQKPVQTNLAWFFWFGSVFSGLALFFSGLARFFFGFFDLSSVRFFWFRAYKTETEPAGFFKILICLIGFFSRFDFFGYFFSVFSV